MRRLSHRSWLLLALGLVVALTGCRFGAKPYANDPLLKSGLAVRGDHEKAHTLVQSGEPEPAAPSRPGSALIVTRGSVDTLTSR